MGGLGMKLRQLRQVRHLTQSEVADRIHCDRSYLSRIERGEVSPAVDLLQALCETFAVSLDQVLETPQRADGDFVVRRCLSLMEQGRVAEAQTLAAASWWDYLDGSSDIADRLLAILTDTRNDTPEVLTIILANMFRQATTNRIDEAFFRHGFHLQRALAEHGQLRASWIFCQSLLALDPGPADAFALTLSLGTTLFRLKDLHLASAMYAKSRDLWGEPMRRVNLGRALHGLGACELDLHHPAAATRLTQSACEVYAETSADLYHLALQNLAMAHHLNREPARTTRYLEQCARYWADRGDTPHVQEVEALLVSIH